jgi:general stress protein YciG
VCSSDLLWLAGRFLNKIHCRPWNDEALGRLVLSSLVNARTWPTYGLSSNSQEPKMGSSKRGFGSMDPEKQRESARKGGQSVPSERRSFSQDHELAARAGRMGGKAVRPENRSFSLNHALASEAGRKGGHASHGVKR